MAWRKYSVRHAYAQQGWMFVQVMCAIADVTRSGVKKKNYWAKVILKDAKDESRQEKKELIIWLELFFWMFYLYETCLVFRSGDCISPVI